MSEIWVLVVKKVLTAHGDTEERTNSQELWVGVAESRSELKHRDQDQVADQGPLPAESIGENTEEQRAKRSEEQCEGDSGGDCLPSAPYYDKAERKPNYSPLYRRRIAWPVV